MKKMIFIALGALLLNGCSAMSNVCKKVGPPFCYEVSQAETVESSTNNA